MISTKQEFLAEGFGQHFPWLDLANSQQWDGFGELTDHLSNAQWLALFLRYWEIHPRDNRALPHDGIVRLRAVLRSIAEKLAARRSLDNQDVKAINSALDVPVRQELKSRGKHLHQRLSPLRKGWPWVRAQIAASLTEMLTQHRPDRLKICPNPGCKWVFYDSTKGNTRRWCNDRRCGNRDRVRRARAAMKHTTA
jgi:predicted RNA-binding Zn ribbon-like protein